MQSHGRRLFDWRNNGCSNTLNKIKAQVVSDLETVQSTAELEALQVKVLGKKGELTALLKSLGKLPQEERPKMGAAINEARKSPAGKNRPARAGAEAQGARRSAEAGGDRRHRTPEASEGRHGAPHHHRDERDDRVLYGHGL